MKVKQQPDDFRVEELSDVTPGREGDFALYRLDKVGWTTPDAVHLIRRRWNVDRKRVGYGGLKDRHADTSQFFTIFRGPQRNLSQDRVQVTYLGQSSEPFTSRHVAANRFTIVLRHLTPDAISVAQIAAQESEATGLANYFDDQRFGSVGRDRRFVAKEMVLGRFDEALKLALAGEYEHDRAADRKEKAALLRHWGDWPTCKAALPRGHARSLVDYLITHPTDFKGAVARLRPELQGLYLAAYQSDLWNRMLDRWLRDTFPADALGLVSLRLGEYTVPRTVPNDVAERWQSLALPLPSARVKPSPNDGWSRIAETVLAEEGLTLAQVKIPGLQKPFFSKGERTACLRPTHVRTEVGDDELNRGRRKLTLAFELPRGSYATMFIKRVTAFRPFTSPPPDPETACR